MADAQMLLAPQAAAKGLRLTLAVDAHVPAVILGDAGRLRQILVNLLSNAVKFTAQGGVTLAVTSAPGDNGRHRMEIRASDTGIGIALALREQLFQPFVQGDGSAALARAHAARGHQ